MKRFLFLLGAAGVAVALLGIQSSSSGSAANGDTVWAQRAGGSTAATEAGRSVAFDNAGNVYVVGSFQGTATFSGSATTLTSAGSNDGLLAKYDASGNLLWAVRWGGAGVFDIGWGVAYDATSDSVIVCGSYSAGATVGSIALPAVAGGGDGMLAKFDSAGTPIWAIRTAGGTQAGTSDNRDGAGCVVDGSGNVYTTGSANGASATFGGAGSGGGTPVVLTTAGTIDAYVAKYDSTGAFQWVAQGGGPGAELGRRIAIAADASGDLVIGGDFAGATATFGAATINNLSATGTDGFVARVSNGGAWIWARAIGCSSGCAATANDVARGVAPAGNDIIVAGGFSGTLAVGGAATTTVSAGGVDLFVIRLDTAGNVIWSRAIGGTSDEDAGGVTGAEVAVDNDGNIVVGGTYQGSVTLGADSAVSNGAKDLLVAKLDAAGNGLWISSPTGGPTDDALAGLATDANGAVAYAGQFTGVAPNTASFGSASFSVNGTGGTDIVVGYITADTAPTPTPTPTETVPPTDTPTPGASPTETQPPTDTPTPTATATDTPTPLPTPLNNTVWAKRAGGPGASTGGDIVRGIAFDADGNLIATGTYEGTVDFEGTVLTSNGSNDIQVLKYDPNGNLVWARSWGGPGNDLGLEAAVDANGDIIICGLFSNSVTIGADTLSSAGATDGLLFKLDSDGNPQWARNVTSGPGSIEGPSECAPDSSGDIALAGSFNSNATFGVGYPGAVTLTNTGGFDAWVGKWDASGNFQWVQPLTGSGNQLGRGVEIATDGTDDVLATGQFVGATNAGPTVLPAGSAVSDVWFARLSPTGSWVWAKSISGGGSTNNIGRGISGIGNDFVLAGQFAGTATFPGSPGIPLTSNGDIDVFAARFDANGNVIWARNVGGTAADEGAEVSVAPSGNMVVTGHYAGTVQFAGMAATSAGLRDQLVVEFAPNGTENWISGPTGGAGEDINFAAAADPFGNYAYAGQFVGTSTYGSTVLVSDGASDMMVAKIGNNIPPGTPTPTRTPSPTPTDTPTVTPANSPTGSETATPTSTATATPTATNTPSPSEAFCGGYGGTFRVTTLAGIPNNTPGGPALPAKIYAPDSALQTAPCPAISLLPGGGAAISSVEWAAERLAQSGYVVIITDPRSPSNEATYDEAGKSGIDCLVSALCNPYFADTRTDLIGGGGWSLGARSWTKTQEEDLRVDVIVAWDNLAKSESGDLGSPACANTPVPLRTPRVPGMGQASEGCSTGAPYPGIDAKKDAWLHWRDHGTPSMQVVFAGCNHFCWSAAAGATQHDRNHYYTQAWFDRWLKADTTATDRLVARTVLGQPVETLLSNSNSAAYHHSAVFVDGYDCGEFEVSCGGTSTATPTPTSGPGEVWTPVATMNGAHGYHQTVRLGDGRVLVAGGQEAGSAFTAAFTNQVEIYDSASNTWTVAAPMSLGRGVFSATRLADGRVLVAGGQSGMPFSATFLASAEIYDPVTNTWSPAASMSAARAAHTATLLADGRVLVAGGYSGTLDPSVASVEIYDPVTNTWTPASGMSTPRSSHTASRLPDGRVLVAGGFNGDVLSGVSVAAAEIYDPSSGNWSSAPALSVPRAGHTATMLSDGRILVAGGVNGTPFSTNALPSAEIFSPGSGTWSPAASMAGARASHTATLRADGTVLVAGGYASGGTTIASAELYDATSNNWSTVASLNVPRDTFTATLLPNGLVLAAGGYNGDDLLASAEVFGDASALPTPTPTATPCGGDTDCDGLADFLDNCPTVGNPGQENNDRDFVDLSAYGLANDVTWPNSDLAGDACDPDDDNDSLGDNAETSSPPCVAASSTTNPLKLDTDGDRFMDAYECSVGSDPADAQSRPSYTASTDTDRDGLADFYETVVTNTSPSHPDSDGDGVLDGVELRFYGTNPLAANTDGDACSDGKEVAAVNGDSVVNSADLGIVASRFGSAASPMYVPHLDIDRNGAINAADLALVAAQFGGC